MIKPLALRLHAPLPGGLRHLRRPGLAAGLRLLQLERHSRSGSLRQGYLVVGVNNRGTNNYGSAFMKTTYKRLGYWEAHDFAETARYLATKSWADGTRIAIVGTSYGGYSTLYTMEMYPDLFSVGIANSPVTDWRLYDTIYTERYMGLLSDNAARLRLRARPSSMRGRSRVISC